MLKEFKEFAYRGNVIDLAVGVVLGGAFGQIVSSLVNDIVMPPIGLLIGNVDFTDLFFSLRGDYDSLALAKAAGAPTINYGVFINTILNFTVVAFALFLLIRMINAQRNDPKPTPSTKACPFCLTTIALKATRCPCCTSQIV